MAEYKDFLDFTSSDEGIQQAKQIRTSITRTKDTISLMVDGQPVTVNRCPLIKDNVVIDKKDSDSWAYSRPSEGGGVSVSYFYSTKDATDFLIEKSLIHAWRKLYPPRTAPGLGLHP